MGILSQLWFLVVEVDEPVNRYEVPLFNFADLDRVEHRYTQFPTPVEAALRAFALFDWESIEGMPEYGWTPPDIPFVITVRADLLSSPLGVGDHFSKLNLEPYCDAGTGEELGERPARLHYLARAETERFRHIVRSAFALTSKIPGLDPEWNFVDVALGYLVKAFIADNLEQLLWHITVLEALFGEDRLEIEARLRRRVAKILGFTAAVRDRIGKQVRELYKVRSKLVHGARFDRAVLRRDLGTARSFARRSLLWFLHLLDDVRGSFEMETLPDGLPRREELLSLLDLESESLRRVRWLARQLPSEFFG